MQDAGFCFFIKLKMEPSRFPLRIQKNFLARNKKTIDL